MRVRLLTITAAALILGACSPQDKADARRDSQRAEEKIREGVKKAGQEIKKDLHAADAQLHDSMEKGRAAAQHAAKELRKEINDGDPDRDRDRDRDRDAR